MLLLVAFVLGTAVTPIYGRAKAFYAVAARPPTRQTCVTIFHHHLTIRTGGQLTITIQRAVIPSFGAYTWPGKPIGYPVAPYAVATARAVDRWGVNGVLITYGPEQVDCETTNLASNAPVWNKVCSFTVNNFYPPVRVSCMPALPSYDALREPQHVSTIISAVTSAIRAAGVCNVGGAYKCRQFNPRT